MEKKIPERAKIDKVFIEGFKSYGKMEETGVSFNDINIIIGANGVGKSNFISFLEMIAYIASDGFEKYVARNGFADSLLHFGARNTDRISGKLDFSVGQKRDCYEFVLAKSVGGQMYFDREKISYDNPNYSQPFEKTFGMSVNRSGLLDYSRNDHTVGTILSILRGCRIFHFNDTSINSSMRSPSYLYDNAYLRSDAGNIASFLYGMKMNHFDHYERIIEYIKLVFPRFGDFVLIPSDMEGTDKYLLLNWMENGSEEVFGPHMLSDGTLRFIALVTLLMQPDESMPYVVILDEPEIGLHPHAIKILSDILYQTLDKAQIIVATQSVTLLNNFEVKDVMIADYDNQRKTSTIRSINEKELRGWLETYTIGELWNKNVLGGVPR